MPNAPLDLYSTSQTNQGERCVYGAPLIALIFNHHATIQQACCNHWDCPCCGQTRARQEYRRITWGAEVLADEHHELYFWTLTCRGKELSYADAMAGYYTWTNKLLTSARTKAGRSRTFWAYIQVTEHQKKTRAHPHSHLITTFCPPDAKAQKDSKGRISLFSEWFTASNIRAGLGEQCRISKVENAAAVSRYVAKYLFKEIVGADWPPKWKRIRYSRNWPTPPYQKAELCITLLTPADWKQADEMGVEWLAVDNLRYDIALHHMGHVRRNYDDGSVIF